MKLIVLEGYDNTGKTSLISSIKKELRFKGCLNGENTKTIHNNITFLKTELNYGSDKFKLCNDAHYRLCKTIEEKNKDYDLAIIDRYTYSAYAYNQIIVTPIIEPDIILYLHAPLETLIARDPSEFIKDMIKYSTKEVYDEVCERYKEILKEKNNVVKIDVENLTKEEVEKIAYDKINYLLNK